MIWPKVRASRWIWGLLAGLGLITPCLFSAQVFKYQKIKPEKGYLIQRPPSIWPRLITPGEEFIQKHYLQVRALYIERARLENIQKKEKKNEKTS
jgi:hypothetical protein